MNESQLLAHRAEARRSWLDLDDGRRLRIEALSDGAFRRFCQALGNADMIDALPARVVIGWDGFTEADINPHGSDEPRPFSPALFAAWLDDHQEHLLPVFEACWAACKGAQERLAQITEKPAP